MFAEEMDRDTHGGYTTFASFSRQCKENMMRKRQGSSHSSSTTPLPAVMLTGGFRTQRAIEQSLSIAEADLIGIARPACVDPTWPARMLDPSRGSPDCLDYQPQGIDKIQPYIPLKIAGYGLGTGWHVFQLWKMAHRENTKPTRTFARLAFDELVPSWVKGAAIMGSVAVLNHILNPRRLGWGGASEFEYTQGL